MELKEVGWGWGGGGGGGGVGGGGGGGGEQSGGPPPRHPHWYNFSKVSSAAILHMKLRSELNDENFHLSTGPPLYIEQSKAEILKTQLFPQCLLNVVCPLTIDLTFEEIC